MSWTSIGSDLRISAAKPAAIYLSAATAGWNSDLQRITAAQT